MKALKRIAAGLLVLLVAVLFVCALIGAAVAIGLAAEHWPRLATAMAFIAAGFFVLVLAHSVGKDIFTS